MNGSERRTAKDRVRFKSLDGWRGICALLVALFHIPIKEGFLDMTFFRHANLFVDFFFVLSGFVMNHTYGVSLQLNPKSGKKFLYSRLARLWPLHIAMFGCYVILDLAKIALFGWYHTASEPPPTIPGLIITSFEQIFLLQALIPSPVGIQWNGQSWSISTEFWTYVLFMFLVINCSNRRACAIAIVAFSALLVILFYRGNGVVAWPEFFRCFYGFFVGYLLYEFYNSPASLALTSKWLQAFSTPIEVFCVLAVVVFLSIPAYSTLFFAPPLFAVIIYVFAAEAGLISRFLRGTLSQMLGRYSYSIYMTFALVVSIIIATSRLAEKKFHVRIIRATLVDGSTGNNYLIHFGTRWEMIGLAGVILLAVVLISHFTYLYIEIPCQDFLKNFGNKHLNEFQAGAISSDLK